MHMLVLNNENFAISCPIYVFFLVPFAQARTCSMEVNRSGENSHLFVPIEYRSTYCFDINTNVSSRLFNSPLSGHGNSFACLLGGWLLS